MLFAISATASERVAEAVGNFVSWLSGWAGQLKERPVHPRQHGGRAAELDFTQSMYSYLPLNLA
jgi:hypothetical protein